MSRTHQFLVTLTVHTNKINPATTPTTTSPTSVTDTAPVVVIPRDAQQLLSGDLRVAYRTSREGPRDIVFIPNWPIRGATVVAVPWLRWRIGRR